MFLLGATYNAIEGHFRKIRKEAVQLLEEQCSGAAAVPKTPPKTPRKARVSKKGKAEAGPVVLGGRVKKPSAPAKRGKAAKKEVVAEGQDAFAPAPAIGGKAIKKEPGIEGQDAFTPGPAQIDIDLDLMGSQTEVPFGLNFARAEDMWLSSGDSFSQSFGI